MEVGFNDRMKTMVEDEVSRLVEETRQSIKENRCVRKLFHKEHYCTTRPVCISSSIAKYPCTCNLSDEAFGGIDVGSENQRARLMSFLGRRLKEEGYKITLHTDTYGHQLYSCKFLWK